MPIRKESLSGQTDFQSPCLSGRRSRRNSGPGAINRESSMGVRHGSEEETLPRTGTEARQFELIRLRSAPVLLSVGGRTPGPIRLKYNKEPEESRRIRDASAECGRHGDALRALHRYRGDAGPDIRRLILIFRSLFAVFRFCRVSVKPCEHASGCRGACGDWRGVGCRDLSAWACRRRAWASRADAAG